MLSLHYPLFLWAIPAPIIIAWLIRRTPVSPPPAAIYHPYYDLLKTLSADIEVPRPSTWAYWLSGSFLIIAMAGPYWSSAASLPTGRNIMLAIDVSGSMRALSDAGHGQASSRLDQAKQAVSTLIDAASQDRFGVIVFADHAMTYLPLTRDLPLIKALLGEIGNDIAGERTALGDAIALATQQLRSYDVRSRNLILLSDGRNTAGDIEPNRALKMAATAHVRIFTIAIGTEGLVPYPQGPVKPPLAAQLPIDTALMKRLSEQTGGAYYPAENPDSLSKAIDDIDQLSQVPLINQANQMSQTNDRPDSGYPLYAAAVLIALGLYLWQLYANQRQRILP